MNGGWTPEQVDELDGELVDSLIWIHKCVREKEERETKKGL